MQESRLKSLHGHLLGLLDDGDAVRDAGLDLESGVQELRSYLDGLVYSSPAGSSSIYGATSGLSTMTGGIRGAPGESDAINKIKGEIRGIKGVLLSARNFPGSAGHGGARVRVN